MDRQLLHNILLRIRCSLMSARPVTRESIALGYLMFVVFYLYAKKMKMFHGLLKMSAMIRTEWKHLRTHCAEFRVAPAEFYLYLYGLYVITSQICKA